MKETDRHRIDVDDLGDWVLSDRIYEKTVFIQTLMLIGILVLGMNTFGFERHADQKQLQIQFAQRLGWRLRERRQS